METTTTRPTSEFAEKAFQNFLAAELIRSLPRISAPNDRVYLYCHLVPEGEPSRRLLVVSEPEEKVVRVCVEATYELFEGDVHYHVRRIGTAPREQADEKQLEGLLQTAYSELMAWHPTHESIWENVF
ncbi:MAG: hypothetical protein WCS37_16445 [Chloroflexota bacterium]|nr:hypothetical protein [Chloroflexota bacterium]